MSLLSLCTEQHCLWGRLHRYAANLHPYFFSRDLCIVNLLIGAHVFKWLSKIMSACLELLSHNVICPHLSPAVRPASLCMLTAYCQMLHLVSCIWANAARDTITTWDGCIMSPLLWYSWTVLKLNVPLIRTALLCFLSCHPPLWLLWI